jgi:hypothetical protein
MPDDSTGNISNDLIEAIANSTAMAVGEQPAILANLALANQIANTNLAQQNALSNQQAMFQLELTIVSKCVELIANINPTNASAAQQLQMFQQIMQMFGQINHGAAKATPPPPPATGAGTQTKTVDAEVSAPQTQQADVVAGTTQAPRKAAKAKTRPARGSRKGRSSPPGGTA